MTEKHFLRHWKALKCRQLYFSGQISISKPLLRLRLGIHETTYKLPTLIILLGVLYPPN